MTLKNKSRYGDHAGLATPLPGCSGSSGVAVPPGVAADTTEPSQLPPEIGLARTILRERCMSTAGYPLAGLHADSLAAERHGRYRSPGEAPTPEGQRLAAHVCAQNPRTAGEYLISTEKRILELRESLTRSVGRARGEINGHG